ncbi:MAG: 3-deoxy-manno-octulosonate cytidylyltransferase [Vampirovibrio sp.]
MYRHTESEALNIVTNREASRQDLNPARVVTMIPARYASTRFPAKPLTLIHGIPMVQHVVKRIQESQLGQSRFWVATDDTRIVQALEAFKTPSIMTRVDHPSGSDRLWEALQIIEGTDAYDWVINVQGDEPFISPHDLSTLWQAMQSYQDVADIVTLVTPYFGSDTPHTVEEANALLKNPNRVKAVYTEAGQILYCSRAPIPYLREGLQLSQHTQANSTTYYRHIGVYAYKIKALQRFVEAPVSSLEAYEGLEQLRALSLGLRLYAGVVDKAPIGVDTPEDLELLLSTRV